MRFLLPSIPPLPATWPYRPRPAGEAPSLQAAMDLPGLGKGWSFFGKQSLPFGEEHPLGKAFGRGGVRRCGEVVLRPYRRGGLVRHLNERIYASPMRFAQEFAIHQALWESGFPTVEPLGYAWKRKHWAVEGVYLTRFTACEPWPRHWGSSREVLSELKGQLEALCAWGLFAPDLNATNVMIAAEGEVLLLDWDRAAWGGTKLFMRYQARLLRSLEKLRAPREVIEAVSRWEGA